MDISGESDLIQHWIASAHSESSTHSGGPQASDGDGAIFLLSSASCSEILSPSSDARASLDSVASPATLLPPDDTALSHISQSPSGMN